jgi:hypothetical protein
LGAAQHNLRISAGTHLALSIAAVSPVPTFMIDALALRVR